MKIGIDTFGCEHARSGLGAYLKSLVDHLPASDTVEYELFGSDIDRYTYTDENDIQFYGLSSVSERFWQQRLWHLCSANRLSARRAYDVVLYPAAVHMLPWSFSKPGVAIVNDIVSLIIKNSSPFAALTVTHGLRRASRIIAASNFIKEDLVNLGIAPDKINVVYNGIDHSQFYQHPLLDNDTVTIKPFAIKRPYLIYASRMNSASKKHVELIRAFTLFKEKTHMPHRLVLAGGDGSFAREIEKAVCASSAVSDIFMTGYFPAESFPELYSGAEACIFPSVSEGVGLPVIEAMATGIPVACSRSGALPEIAGDSAVFFDSDNIEEIAGAIERIVTDTGLRDRLVESGLAWTKQFQWNAAAQQTLDVLKMAAADRW